MRKYREWVIISLVLSIYLFVVIKTQWSVFSISYPQSEYEYRYSESQYVKGEQKTIILGDGDIYTYAGIRYIQGEDPTKINFEHPPFIKYLFGLSYILFGKPNWVTIPLFFLAGFSFWYLTAVALKSSLARWFALFLFLLHSTIYMAIPQTMLDFPMTALLLFATALYVLLIRKKQILPALFFGLVLGLLFASKYPIPIIALYAVLLIVWLKLNHVPLKAILVSVSASIVAYVATYLSFFTHGGTPLDFLKFEWWRWQWFQGKTDNQKFMLAQSIFLGRYPKWWDPQGGYHYIQHWNLLWPIEVMLYFGSWFTKPKPLSDILFPYKLWILLTLAIYMLGAAEDRFLIPLIPGFALFGTAFLEAVVARLSRAKTSA